jgi:hypothetical protein
MRGDHLYVRTYPPSPYPPESPHQGRDHLYRMGRPVVHTASVARNQVQFRGPDASTSVARNQIQFRGPDALTEVRELTV